MPESEPKGQAVYRDELIRALESFRNVPAREITPSQQDRIEWHGQLRALLAGPDLAVGAPSGVQLQSTAATQRRAPTKA